MRTKTVRFALSTALALASFTSVRSAFAHCDGLDGPVVGAARQALQKGDVNLALVWVKKNDEPEIRAAFARAMTVRRLGSDARELADTYFFETVVRVHRAGEGAPYTGLKPAGRDLGPAIPAADKALQTGNLEPVNRLLVSAVANGLRDRFRMVRESSHYRSDDVEAGRHFVERYVAFIHYVERLYEAASQPSHGHFDEGATAHSDETNRP